MASGGQSGVPAGAFAKVDYWLQGTNEQNFGDFLSAFLCDRLFLPIGIHAARYRVIGSAIADFIVRDTNDATPSQRLVFWGCGLRDEASLTPDWRQGTEILAVRGPLSHAALRLGPDVPMGDPALLLPAIYRPAASADFAGRSVCIPHFHDRRSDAELLARSGADLVTRPNLPNDQGALLEMVDAIAAADFVLSASLHGAIVAAAYGVKFAYWDNGHLDLPFKWADFAASVAMPCCFAQSVVDGRMLYADVMAPRLRLPSVLPLLAAAPFVVRPEALMQVLAHEAPADLELASEAFAKGQARVAARSGYPGPDWVAAAMAPPSPRPPWWRRLFGWR